MEHQTFVRLVFNPIIFSARLLSNVERSVSIE